MIQLYYKRVHVPSGHVYIAPFNSVQVQELDYLPFLAVERACTDTLARWNRQQPGEWQYTYIGVRNAEVLQYEEEHGE